MGTSFRIVGNRKRIQTGVWKETGNRGIVHTQEKVVRPQEEITLHTSQVSLGIIKLATVFACLFLSWIPGQDLLPHIRSYTQLQKRVFNFTKVEFITENGDFNDAICTLIIPDFKEDSPPYVAIYYKRDNSQWFTESLYRKRVRFSFKDGVIKLDRSNFWDWFEIQEIKVVVIF